MQLAGASIASLGLAACGSKMLETPTVAGPLPGTETPFPPVPPDVTPPVQPSPDPQPTAMPTEVAENMVTNFSATRTWIHFPNYNRVTCDKSSIDYRETVKPFVLDGGGGNTFEVLPSTYSGVFRVELIKKACDNQLIRDIQLEYFGPPPSRLWLHPGYSSMEFYRAEAPPTFPTPPPLSMHFYYSLRRETGQTFTDDMVFEYPGSEGKHTINMEGGARVEIGWSEQSGEFRLPDRVFTWDSWYNDIPQYKIVERIPGNVASGCSAEEKELKYWVNNDHYTTCVWTENPNWPCV